MSTNMPIWISDGMYGISNWTEKVDRKGIIVYMDSRCSSSVGNCTAAAAGREEAGRRKQAGESGQWQVVALCHHHRLLLASLLQLISKCFGRVLSADFFLLKC